MKILTIVGPTAVGKTGHAVEIAKRISGDIVSADSRQIYKHLNIGTAKPNAEQRREAKFHLIDFVEPDQNYSCGQFARDAEEKIRDIVQRKRYPIVCGGTGLYIRAIFQPLDELPASNKEIKERLHKTMDEHGLEYLYQRLLRIDAAWARSITPRDKQRIIRGLEVYEMTGKPLTKLIGKKKKRTDLEPFYIGLVLDRSVLYGRIDRRFDQMIQDGLVNEVESLLARGFNPRSNALRTIGYKEIVLHLQGRMKLDEATENAKRHTRNFAKRQITWFSKIPGITWHDPEEPGIVDIIIKRIKRIMKM
jgi:tRNA dimethylallyltransferase